MRYSFRLMCVCALGVMPLIGCADSTSDGGTAGVGGNGGTAGSGGGGSGGQGGMAGEGGTGGSAAIKPGTWRGGDPASNTNDEPFDTGWAICFHVSNDGTELALEDDCEIDELFGRTFLQISWKEDASSWMGEPANCAAGIGVSRNSGSGDGNYVSEVPIVDNSFELKFEESVDTNWDIVGTFNGDTASGTARVWASLGMGGFFCELAEWTATAPTAGG